MFKNFVKFSVKEPAIFLVLMGVLVGLGFYAKETVPIDAIPNIGQNQVIVIAEWSGRSPKDVEDQVTYPLSVSLLAMPGADSVRGKSLFGFSFVQVTFKDDIDFYWARSRVSEQLSTARSSLPDGVNPTLGPDATGLGQIFYYVLEDKQGKNLAELRSLQDYTIKYALQAVEGVSEVASIGGYERQYQVEVDPDRLRFHNITINQLNQAIRMANEDVGAKTVEQSGMEFIVRSKGFLGGSLGPGQTIQDIENAVVTSNTGVPVRVKDLGFVQSGSNFRRGALDYNGAEAVGGVVVMRFGENPRAVIERVKEKISSLEPSLDGVKIKAVYDRTQLIDETVATLTEALAHEILITILIVFLFLLHFRSSLIVAATLPVAVLIAFIAMKVFQLDANIMSLAGIAIAIGNMVDLGIVVTENIYQHLCDLRKNQETPKKKHIINSITGAVVEIAPAISTAITTTVVSFLPVFFLTGRDFKLFAPLAWTKTFALVAALIVAVVFIPVLCRLFLKPKHLKPPEDNPVSKAIHKVYEPLLRLALKHRITVLATPFVIFAIGLGAWGQLKSDDWIALDEGSLFYMPTLYPAASFSKSLEVLQTQDTLIKEIPEVKDVLGKIGRVDSALDPAPAAMVETVITLKPKDQWRPGYTTAMIWQEITQKATLPGVTPASYLQPIEGRVVMLQSGIKAPIAIRIYGDDLATLASAAKQVGEQLKTFPEVNGATVNPDIVLGKPYAEFDINRQTAARYGMTVSAINEIVETAVGGKIVGQTVEGRERYSIRVRYLREYRDNLETLEDLPVVTKVGEVVPLGVLANMTTTWGPGAISSEDARLVAHVAFATSGTMGDLESVEAVMERLDQARSQGDLALPQGYEIQAVGSFQNQIEANQRLILLVPLVVLINLFLIFLQFRRLSVSLLVFTGIPVAFGGGMVLLWLFNIEINTAVWVGFIALFGISIDDGIILTTYLQSVFRSQAPHSKEQVIEGVVQAGLRRVRPCLMTTMTTMIALVPVVLATGRGADVARAMALPILGGMFVALFELILVPVVYSLIKEREIASPKPETN